MDALEILPADARQILLSRAAYSPEWAEYLILVNACCEVIKRLPQTGHADDLLTIEDLLEQGLESLGKAIGTVLPGGVYEFSHYIPLSSNKKRN